MADENVTRLDLERASRFLDKLAKDPFVCIVVTEDGEEWIEDGAKPKVLIYSKNVGPEQLERIKTALKEAGEDQ